MKMTRTHQLSIAGKTAIIAALMGGSSLSFAQDAAPSVAAPAQPTPVEVPTVAPAVAPPPAVSTLPSPNDTINPAAAQEAAAEATRLRQATATPKAVSKPRVAAPVSAARTEAVAPDTAVEASTAIAPPAVEVMEPAVAPIEDIAPVASVDESTAQDEGFSTEDMTLVGGLAAALAAIGLGAAFASRRRRRVVADDHVAVIHTAPEYPAPRPIKEDPVFQQFAPAPAAATVATRPLQRAPIMTRPDVPVTDPLFSTPVIAGPITDPLFAPRNDVQPPITDPLFAKHDRFVGHTPATPATTRERELVN
jgi:MYXO-CTERM domain-containing protein